MASRNISMSEETANNMADIIARMQNLIKERDAAAECLHDQSLGAEKGQLVINSSKGEKVIQIPGILLRQAVENFIHHCGVQIDQLRRDLMEANSI